MNIKSKSGSFRKIAVFSLLVVLLSACGALNPGASLSSPTPKASDPFDATLTAVNIIAKKATDGAAMAQTIAAQPTDTPTPTPPSANTATCQSADLSAEARSNGATGSITFSIVLTNVGNRTCLLQGPPDVQLVNKQGLPLKIDVFTNCFLCGQENINEKTPSPATQEVIAPTQTAQAQTILSGQLGLAPGKAAKIFLIWSNYCEPFPPGGVNVRLSLPPDGQLDIITDAYTGGRCDASDHPSTLMVSQYSYK